MHPGARCTRWGCTMKLPATVQEIADVIGHERALLLIGQLPRCYSPHHGAQVILYVPTLPRLKPSHDLVRILGWDDAVKMCTAFGGEILKPANCAGLYRDFRDKHITRLLMEGVSVQMVAEWFRVSDRHVKNLQREIPQEEMKAANDNTAPVKRPGRRNNGRHQAEHN